MKQARKWGACGALALLMALSLCGCSNGDDHSNADSQTPSSSNTTQTTPSTSGTDADTGRNRDMGWGDLQDDLGLNPNNGRVN